MIIVKDERVDCQIGCCEQCGILSKGRKVKATGLFGESRGYFFLCFNCFGPRIHWKYTPNSTRVYSTPAPPEPSRPEQPQKAAGEEIT